MNDRSAQTPKIAVIGGGLAGLSAGCALAESGLQVTLFERRPYLGGRASSYQHPATGEIIDNCQHVLFGSCTNLIEFYGRIGVKDKIRWSDEMTFIEPGAHLDPASQLSSGTVAYGTVISKLSFPEFPRQARNRPRHGVPGSVCASRHW